MERVQAAHNNHWGLKDRTALLRLSRNDYIEGRGPTQAHTLHKTQNEIRKIIIMEKEKKEEKKRTNRKRKTTRESQLCQY